MTVDRVQIIAHRGASHSRPENSLAAFDEAVHQGCDAIEIDVQLTQDRVPVVFHDKNLARFDEESLGIHDLTFCEVRALELPAPPENGSRRQAAGANGQRVPTLEEVLSRYGSRIPLFVEVKTREGEAGWSRHVELMQRTLQALQAHGLGSGVSILSYDADLLEICARQAPHLPRLLNLRPPPSLETDLMQAAARVSALSLSVRTLTAGFAAAVREAALPVMVFTCNDDDQVARALEAAPRGVMSDRPDWLRSQVRPRQAKV